MSYMSQNLPFVSLIQCTRSKLPNLVAHVTVVSAAEEGPERTTAGPATPPPP